MRTDILEVIKARRSVDEFLPKYVDWEKVGKILDAARHAPSSGNIQNWKFIVCDDGAQKQSIAEAAFEQYKIALASHLIVVCAEVEKAQRYYGLRGERLYSIQNCAAAVQNMLLQAESLGLGTKWIGAFDEDKVRDICGIPMDIRPQAIVAIGFAKAKPAKPPKYPLETLVYLGKWRSKIRNINRYLGTYSAILKKNLNKYKQGVRDTTQRTQRKFAPKFTGQSKKIKQEAVNSMLSMTDKIRERLKKQAKEEGEE